MALLAAVFGAIEYVLARQLLKYFRPNQFVILGFFIVLVVLLIFSPFFYFFKLTLISIGLLILMALIDTGANYFYFKTLEKSEASIAAPVLSLAPGFTFLLGWLFIGDMVSVRTYFLAGLIIFLVILFSIDFKNFKKFRVNTLAPALASSFLFGVSAIPAKILLTNLAAINGATLYMLRAGLIMTFAFFLFGFSFKNIKVKHLPLFIVQNVMAIIQWILLYGALAKGNAGVTLTLMNTAPIFVFFLSVIFLREKPTLKKLLASALILGLSFII